MNQSLNKLKIIAEFESLIYKKSQSSQRENKTVFTNQDQERLDCIKIKLIIAMKCVEKLLKMEPVDLNWLVVLDGPEREFNENDSLKELKDYLLSDTKLCEIID